jgi:hypothetical protein
MMDTLLYIMRHDMVIWKSLGNSLIMVLLLMKWIGMGLLYIFPRRDYGHLEIVRELINSGASVDIKNRDGWTALHEASSRVFPEIVRELIGYNANVNEKTDPGWTPLHLVVMGTAIICNKRITYTWRF